ncbi:MAG: Txe/YoeB family addiction module toxin [Prevotellaceae bacterium]|jgi:toxin YoeB|nr:Txe/YoeB family addiction module toxin [Prevotellaceae bacterium]
MEITYSPKALDDIEKIKKSGLNSHKQRLERIIKSILENPYEGFGNPEQLKHEFTGKWSRELSKKDRVLYMVENDDIFILSILGHYTDK